MNIPEIRDTVLNFLEPPDLASCARTCRLWSIPALRPLWRDVRKWRPLFAILGELKSEGETQQVVGTVSHYFFLLVTYIMPLVLCEDSNI